MRDVGCNSDLGRNVTGEFLELWIESLPDINVQVLASVLRRGQQRLRDFVVGFLSPPISDWRNGNIVFAADFCQASVGRAKFLGECPHGSRPDFFVELGRVRRILVWLISLSYRRDEWLLSSDFVVGRLSVQNTSQSKKGPRTPSANRAAMGHKHGVSEAFLNCSHEGIRFVSDSPGLGATGQEIRAID
jgi:hypothetical protein